MVHKRRKLKMVSKMEELLAKAKAKKAEQQSSPPIRDKSLDDEPELELEDDDISEELFEEEGELVENCEEPTEEVMVNTGPVEDAAIDPEKYNELSLEQKDNFTATVQQLRNLAAALETDNPGIDNYMRDINENLREFPELVYLLKAEEIAPLYKYIRQQTNIEISTKKNKKKGKNADVGGGKTAADFL